MTTEKPHKKELHYFDSNLYSGFVDDPSFAKQMQTIIRERHAHVCVSPITLDEIKRANPERRRALVGAIRQFDENLLFLKHPAELIDLEYFKAMAGQPVDQSMVAETRKEEIDAFRRFLATAEVSEDDCARIERQRLLSHYLQILTRKEPKGSYSTSEVMRSREELLNLTADQLREKIEALRNHEFVNEPYCQKDVINGMRLDLITIAIKHRPGVQYFFDRKAGPMMKQEWPGKDGDKKIAQRIMSIDLKKACPGSWMRMTVLFKQMSSTIKASNANDAAHAAFYPYANYFATGDKAFAAILAEIMEKGA